MAIFISHSSHDKQWVREFVNKLRDDDLPVWFDEDNIVPGDSIPEACALAIDESRVVVIVLSKNSITSGWVTEEISGALFRVLKDKSRRIVPILIEHCDVPEMLAHRKCYDLTDYPDGLPKLLEFLHSLDEVRAAPYLDIPNYKSFRILGEGSFGVVYECIHKETSQRCALKLAKSSAIPLNSEKALHKILSKSSYVVPIIDSGQWRKREFVVMPYVGRSLKWHLRQGKIQKGQIDGILNIAEGIIAGLAEAHELGIIHCDVKPSNILVDDLGRPILCDFGISREVANIHLTLSTVIRGTICYMSPEQQMALPINPQTDIYSFGAVLYEMLTGVKPIGRFKDAFDHNPQVPARLEAIVNQCLEVDLNSRYGTCKEVLSALRDTRSSLAIGRRLREARHSSRAPFVKSSIMTKTMETLEKVSAIDMDVLLTGPVGCGKSLLASWSHQHSPRRAGPFVSVNASSIPESLALSELFGHARGAFTGATSVHTGQIQQANGGTLFLDEVSDLPLGVQAYLLRVLVDGVFRPMGSSKDIRVDVRWIFASNRDLPELVNKKLFRSDLLSRISYNLRIPPLAERKDEIIPLAVEYATRYGVSLNFSAEARKALEEHLWPGNVRELFTFIEHLIVRNFALGEHIHVAKETFGEFCGQFSPNAKQPLIIHPELCESPYRHAAGTALRSFDRWYLYSNLENAKGDLAQATARSGLSRRTLVKKANAAGIEWKKLVSL